MILHKYILIVFQIMILESSGFNLNLKSNQIIQDPSTSTGTYFGYSVAFQKRSGTEKTHNPWLLVGSPRSNITFLRSSEPGNIFNCSTGTRGKCISIMNEEIFPRNYDNHWDNSWIGAVVKTFSFESGNVILVCGPRYGPDHRRKAVNSLRGICFLLENIDNTDDKYVVYGQSSVFGIAADFEKVQSYWSAVISNISLDGWKGDVDRFRKYSPSQTEPNTTKKYQVDNNSYSYFGYSIVAGKTGNLLYVSSPRAEQKGKVDVLRPGIHATPRQSFEGEQNGEYFGASLCVVDVNSDGIDDIIVGAPFYAASDDSYNEGRIYIIISGRVKNDLLQQIGYRYGEASLKTGAHFGLSISAIGDLNRDGFPDVAVGAPYENGRGAIYIFIGNRELGLSEQYSQHIQASEIHNSLLGFGISITGEQDIDSNNFDDIAVGSYISSQVVLLKSKPVISLNGKLKILSEFYGNLSISEKSHVISACVSYKKGNIPTDPAFVKMNIDVDPIFKRAKSVDANSTTSTSIESSIEAISEIYQDSKFCLNFTFQVQEHIKNIDDPLLIKMRYFTVPDERCRRECPITDPNSESLRVMELPFKTYVTDLSLSARFINITGSTYMHASANQNIMVEITILNTQELSIATKLDVNISSVLSVNLVKGDDRCKALTRGKPLHGKTHYSCDFKKIRQLEKAIITIYLSTSDLTENIDELFFSFSVTSSSKEANEDDNHLSMKLFVHLDAPLFISGFANPAEIIVSNNDKSEKNNYFKHIYEVSNRSPVKLTVLVNVTVPIPVIISDGETVPMFLADVRLSNAMPCTNHIDERLEKYFSEWHGIPDQNFTRSLGEKLKLTIKNIIQQDFDCNFQSQFSSEPSIALICAEFSCVINSFEGNSTVEITMRSSYKVFDFLIGPDGMRKFISEADLSLSHMHPRFHLSGDHEAAVDTIILVYFQKYPLWPFILAIVLTILMMVIITYGLYKVNFFKRNRVKKEISNAAGTTSTEQLVS